MDHDSHPSPEAREKPNLSRFFVDNRAVAWVLLVATLLWGAFAYFQMPKRKDPEIPVRVAVAICPWPGISAGRVEDLVTRKLEQAIAGNARVERIESSTRDSVAVAFVYLQQTVNDTKTEFLDIGQRLGQLRDLPQGAGPVTWISDFGDTAALMLTVASPEVSTAELSLRARAIREAIEGARRATSGPRTSALYCFPPTIGAALVRRPFRLFAAAAERDGLLSDTRELEAAGCVGVDFVAHATDERLRQYGASFLREQLGVYEPHPDAWGPILIHDPASTRAQVQQFAGARYSYRELDDFTDTIQRALQAVPLVAKVTRAGVLEERIYLDYSQERLAANELQPWKLAAVLQSRNTTVPGGILDTESQHLVIDPSAEFKSEADLGNVLVGASSAGAPVYLRDLVEVERGYESPARFLNYLTWRGDDGRWHRTRAITLAVQMRSGEQIGRFGQDVASALREVQRRLPPDLVVVRTSDQPKQVRENVDLFMLSLFEAIVLVVLVALVGFWEWRTALLVAVSIPLSLAMTFGAMRILGLDIQQVSIATLIIALGLLVDMPVVAGDSIKRELAAGTGRHTAAWLGPTRLAKAIFYATLTNVVAYLPFLLLSGDIGRFLHSLPMVMTSALTASFLVSLTFIPLVAFGLVRPSSKPEISIEERRASGATGAYYRLGRAALAHRWAVLGGALVLLILGGLLLLRLRTQFFPKDLSYLSYVDVWLPQAAPLGATDRAAAEAERIIRQEAERYGEDHGGKSVLQGLTTFVGGGGPRFWFSVQPEQQQLNYAQILVEVTDKHFTSDLVGPLQTALSRGVPGARADVRQLETGKPVGVPVSIRLSGSDIPTLRALAAELEAILRSAPAAARVRSDWGQPVFLARLKVDPDRANLSGVTNLDVALSSTAAISGLPISVLRTGDKQIPIVARLRAEERGQLTDIENLYVFSLTGTERVPLRQISTLAAEMAIQKVMRRNQFRTITVSAFPEPGTLPSQVLGPARKAIDAFARRLPPGYGLEIGGEYEEQQKGFLELAIIMAISVALIYVALVFQFRSAVKPLVVFAAIPFGIAGAIAALAIMGQPFGFMAFLGVASLVGVIVSHIIVLFDFIEEAHERGEPLQQALLDAGLMRLRPVLITVGATVLGLVPLALHGGPLWEPLCYAQIGGLCVATGVTLVLVPVLYSVLVTDLHILSWKERPPTP